MNQQRLKTNTLTTLANITYYGATLTAGVALHQLMDNPGPLGIVLVLVFTLTVAGILHTLLDEVLDAAARRWDPAPADATGETPESTR